MQIPEGYLRLEDAVKLSQRSEKTIRVWADRKRIGRRKWRGLALYNRADLEAQLADQVETAIVKPIGAQVMEQMTGALKAAISEQLPLPAPVAESISLSDLSCKRYLTFREAARLDGRREAHLRELARAAGVVLEGQGPRGADLIRQADLERI